MPGRYSYRVYASCDADQHAERLEKWNQSYDQLSPGRFDGRLVCCWFGRVQLFREITNQSVHESGNPWPGSRTFAVPLAAADGRGWVKSQMLDSGGAFTLGPKDELDFCTPRQLDLAGISFEAEALSAFAGVVDGRDVERELQSQTVLRPSPECLAAAQAFLRGLFAMLDASHDMLAYAAVQKGIEQALMTAMLGLFTEPNEDRPRRSALSYRRVVAAARDYVLAHSFEPVTVPDLCRRVGVSRRTLQTCFKEVMGVSPVQYLRALRLNAVRRELRAAQPGCVQVQNIAARWGFWHLSSFSADYKKMFGEKPSQTLSGTCGKFTTAGGVC